MNLVPAFSTIKSLPVFLDAEGTLCFQLDSDKPLEKIIFPPPATPDDKVSHTMNLNKY
jgi:hypothetical protein